MVLSALSSVGLLKLNNVFDKTQILRRISHGNTLKYFGFCGSSNQKVLDICSIRPDTYTISCVHALDTLG